MSIRLSKAIKECNVGLQTAVDFLNSKGNSEVEANLNTKISDEQYNMLLKEFKPDSVLKDAANQMLQQQKEEKERKEKEKAEARAKAKEEAEAKAKAEEEAAAKKQKSLKVVGHIDLNAPKKAEKTVAAEKQQEKDSTEAKSVPTDDNAPQIITDGKVTGTLENGVFRLNVPQQPSGGLKVQGHIDLDALNQSTRPKKKSKDERKREREEKQQQAQAERKKQRVRGAKEKVDVNAVVSQQKQQGNGKNQNGKNGQGGKNNTQSQQNGQGKKDKKKQKNQPKQQPVEVSEEEVAKQVRETLARLTSKNKVGKGAKYRREKREAFREQMEEEMMNEMAENKVLKLTEFVTANELATMMNVPVTSIISTCMSIGIMVSINQRMDAETINIVAEEYGFKTEYVSAEVSEAVIEEEDDETELTQRAPIVTVMGHVDHGKTSLLDYIRQANVIAGEAGGITQHIGAYNVTLKDGRRVTFLDTPGHEAFTAMRARGAQVTDIAIIIIAADDNIMPQTKEAIAHATAANVPIVFAINKIDKPTANPDKIKEGLAAMNFLVEDWGGKYQSQDISAKSGLGVEELLEKVLLEAEMLDLKANPNRKATGSIIESSLDKGRGYVATVLVSNGTLRVGDVMLAGTNHGRVKAMFDERGRRVTEIGPSQAATILGLNGAPTAGDTFHIMENDQEARDIANKREQLAREQGLRTMKRVDLTEIGRRIALGDFQELNLLVKGDVDGSIEALKDSFERLSTEKIKVNVIYKAVGQISESDVTLAAASDAIIIAFQVRPSAQARRLAEQEGVDIRQYSVIYDAIEEVKDAMEGMLSPEIKEEVTAQVEVRQVYHISKVGTVAGAYVIDGKVSRSNKARVIRDGIVIFTGEINALKRFKDDVKEVTTNFECGISLVNYNDLREGDTIETFTEIEIKAKL
ncbi:MAG: translation initiation factor IF-2 [Bacteroidaceae bacterium]|nr:translation initiation factor IF-2 [Bacteroidaceae bacterium]